MNLKIEFWYLSESTKLSNRQKRKEIHSINPLIRKKSLRSDEPRVESSQSVRERSNRSLFILVVFRFTEKTS